MKKIIIVISIVVVLGAFLTYQMLSLASHQCSLCIDFNGRTECPTALGPTEKEALEEAHRNACAVLSSGVTQVLACNRTEGYNVKCEAKFELAK